MLSPIALIAVFTVVWLVLTAGLYRLERRRLGPRDRKDTATASAATLVQVVVLGLGGLWFVLAATMWLLLIPAFTVYFLQSCGFAPLMVAMCVGYNAFTLWLAHTLLTRTPRTLRKMAAEAGWNAPAPLRGDA